MAAPTRADLFMSVASLRNGKEESFEELRVEDYLQAYIATGRPPTPVPQVPTAPLERAALGLPPLFAPRLVDAPGSATTPISGTNAIPNGTALNGAPPPMPAVHAFRPTVDEPADPRAGKVFLQSVACQPEFRWWSFEELRCSAYASGQVFAAAPQLPPVPTAAPVLSVAQTNGHTPPVANPNEKMMCMSCDPVFSKHSLEELRVVYCRVGRELTSDEILGQNNYLRMQ